jgi:hypothetical protein
MSRLGFYSYAALTCVILVFGQGTGPPSAAAEECGQGYRICNGSCDGLVQSNTKVLVCKNGCNLRLIACSLTPSATTNVDGQALRGAQEAGGAKGGGGSVW